LYVYIYITLNVVDYGVAKRWHSTIDTWDESRVGGVVAKKSGI